MGGAFKLLVSLLGLGTAGGGLASIFGLSSDNTGDGRLMGLLGRMGDFADDQVLDRMMDALGVKGTEAEGSAKMALTLTAVSMGAAAALPNSMGEIKKAAWMYPLIGAVLVAAGSFLKGDFNNVSVDNVVNALNRDAESSAEQNRDTGVVAPAAAPESRFDRDAINARVAEILANSVAQVGEQNIDRTDGVARDVGLDEDVDPQGPALENE